MSESPERGSPTPHVGVLAGMRLATGAIIVTMLVSAALKLATDSSLTTWIALPDMAARGCCDHWFGAALRELDARTRGNGLQPR